MPNSPMSIYVSGAVEGIVDEAVFTRLVRFTRAGVGTVHRAEGKSRLLARLSGFNHAARHQPWLVLVDLNGDADCAPEFRRRHLRRPSRFMAFRVAVRAVEAWLLADRVRVASWLCVSEKWVPTRPDAELDPKKTLIEIAGRSASRDIRMEMVPRPGSGRSVGPLYSSRLIEFIQNERWGWRPPAAARSSESLERCLRDLRRLTQPSGTRGR